MSKEAEVTPKVEGPFGSDEELRATINEVAGFRNAIDGRMVDIAIELLADESWKGDGLGTPEKFLAFRCGLAPTTAKRYLDAARRATEIPESIDALRRGELSLDQLMPIVRRVPSWADGQVLRLSKMLTVSQINATINKYDFERSGPPGRNDTETENDTNAENSDGDVDEPAEESQVEPTDAQEPAAPQIPKDRCWMGTGDDGRWRINLETSPELGALIESAIDEARDRLFRESGNLISDAEALADVAVRSLEAIDDDARRDRFRTNIHLNTDGQATNHLGTPIPDTIRQHLTCDGLLTPIFYENGVPVSVGRGQRIVPDRTRRLVLQRDHGCAVPGCGATRHLETHHIIHWSNGGLTDTPNLITLCTHHHRAHHHGQLGITGDADEGTVIFTNNRGINMHHDGPKPKPPTGPPPKPSGRYTKPLGELLDPNCVSFTHPQRRAAIKQAAAANRETTRKHDADYAEYRRKITERHQRLLAANPHR